MLVFKRFDTNKLRKATPAQEETYKAAVESNDDIYIYNKDGTIFGLQKCTKFDAYIFIGSDQTIKGMIYDVGKLELQLLSTDPDIGTAVIGDTNRADFDSIAPHNYAIYYMGNVVEILQGERIWFSELKPIIGWHGSYSPPTGM